MSIIGKNVKKIEHSYICITIFTNSFFKTLSIELPYDRAITFLEM